MGIDWDNFELHIDGVFTIEDVEEAIDECIDAFMFYEDAKRSAPIELEDLYMELVYLKEEM